MKRAFTDALGRRIELEYPPRKVISLCPSQTETLFALGAGESVVGVTRYCVHPRAETSSRIKVGGTKKIDMKQVRSLAPDLIIGEKEENTPEMIAELEREFPVYITEVKDLLSAYRMIGDLGLLVNRETAAQGLVSQIRESLLKIASAPAKRAAYFIWKKPLMVAGQDTFIHGMMELAGFQNVFGDRAERYPEVTVEQLRAVNPEVILLSSEPYPFKEKHLAEFREIVPGADVRIVDGEMFSWYGSRMLEFAEYLKGGSKR